ncbi:response regulator transcription factor [Mesobacillus subterraneus]|uniref:Transcriptional regulator n=2 Tax=Mesobacillus TaxID=2675231 RepID=A0A0D6ZBE7_9BACI|nr:transcriptional regulator [Mesobacillus subterraneus]MDQ0413328.1 two-component system response regulator ResD [Mesobacillus stamsii]
MEKILVVDDEFEMRQLIGLYLRQENYQVENAENGQEALEKVKRDDYDLIVLDIMMPLLDGWQTVEHIRKISDVPVIMLTAKGSVKDKVTGLSTGADDYVVKPFDAEELLARIKALLRRSKSKEEEDDILKYQGIVINLTAREAVYNNIILSLTQTELDLLHALIENRGKVLSREQLVDKIWGIEFMGEDRTVDSHIKNLREKLKSAGIDKNLVKTVWGLGYKVE